MELSELQLSRIKRTKILIVDDLPENLQILGNTLRENGFQIAFATSGKQALSVAALKNPNLILLDMTMPEMDGLTVCKKLKENPRHKQYSNYIFNCQNRNRKHYESIVPWCCGLRC